ncbi:hypothetical protein ACIOUE_00960 [Streptomyces xanthochromogenes]|uniref:hypothetical protein n=1 Tax=Streptomyces xanthochromogenes TaxID=67384 RepID=UPI0038295491
MTLPVGISTVTVTGTYTHPDGTPMRGTVSLCPHPGKVVAATSGLVVQGPVAQSLDATGTLTMTVVATDSAGISPTGFTYDVRIAFSDAPGDSFPLSLPKAAPTVSLPAATPATSPASGTYLVVNLVQSVNAKTGAVVLGAGDVGADASGAATGAVTAHAGASDPHGDRAYGNATFATASGLSTLSGTVVTLNSYLDDLLNRVTAVEQGTAFLAGLNVVGPIAASGNIGHTGAPGTATIGFWGKTPTTRPTVTGSRASGAALVSLIAALKSLGLIDDQTTS